MNLVNILFPIFAGSIGIILGICIKKYRMTDIVAGFNPDKYDRDKVSDIAGSNIFLAGIVIIFFGVLRAFFVKYESILSISEKITILLVIINLFYRCNKFGLKNK